MITGLLRQVVEWKAWLSFFGKENKNQEDDDMKIIREKLSSVLKVLDPLEDACTKKTKADSLLEELWFNLGGDKWEDLQKNNKVTGENPDQFSYLSSLETKQHW